MRNISLVCVVLAAAGGAGAVEFTFSEQPGQLVLLGDGKPWLSTLIAPYDPARKEETYKVYTHVYDFAGNAPITKGPGGKYTHHRGLFIGWKKVTVEGQEYNLWEMSNSYQEHVAWITRDAERDKAVQSQKIRWCALDGKPLIMETRTISVSPGENGLRIIDFQSSLTSNAGPILLRGDPHHAGMQIRMDDEVSRHEDTTQYILPEGAREKENDEVEEAWWVCGSMVVRDTRYWIVHMTPRSHPGGVPVYSIRRYARFGAFSEHDLEAGRPLELRYRLVVSEGPLDRAACERLYAAYTK